MSQPLFLQKLLEKPEGYRRNVAYLATAFIGLIIFSIWLFITSHSIKQAFKPTQQELNVARDFQKNLFAEQGKNFQTTIAQPEVTNVMETVNQVIQNSNEQAPQNILAPAIQEEKAPTDLKIQNSFENLIKN